MLSKYERQRQQQGKASTLFSNVHQRIISITPGNMLNFIGRNPKYSPSDCTYMMYQTTHVVGTLGYLAPEQYRTGKATTRTDVYAFGTLVLEVVSGRRPINLSTLADGDVLLAEWVFSCWSHGRILEAVDQNLKGDFISDEAELVLKIGLLCCNSEPKARPSMQRVMLYLDGSMPMPELSRDGVLADGIALAYGASFGDALNSLSDISSHSRPSRGSGSQSGLHRNTETELVID